MPPIRVGTHSQVTFNLQLRTPHQRSLVFLQMLTLKAHNLGFWNLNVAPYEVMQLSKMHIHCWGCEVTCSFGFAGSDAGFQGPAGAKGAKRGKKGGPAVTGRLPASWRAFTLRLHTSQPKALVYSCLRGIWGGGGAGGVWTKWDHPVLAKSWYITNNDKGALERKWEEVDRPWSSSRVCVAGDGLSNCRGSSTWIVD